MRTCVSSTPRFKIENHGEDGKKGLRVRTRCRQWKREFAGRFAIVSANGVALPTTAALAGAPVDDHELLNSP